jgi:two-component system NarL family sensor kinase
VDIARTQSINIPAPALEEVVLEHARRGVRLQIVLRAAMVVFVALTILFVAPARNRAACDVVVAAYAASTIAVGVWSWRGRPSTLRFGWIALFGDLGALAALTLLAGASARVSWTADVLVNGFFLVPLMAATQLRPDVAAAVVGPTIVVYLLEHPHQVGQRGTVGLDPAAHICAGCPGLWIGGAFVDPALAGGDDH